LEQRDLKTYQTDLHQIFTAVNVQFDIRFIIAQGLPWQPILGVGVNIAQPLPYFASKTTLGL